MQLRMRTVRAVTNSELCFITKDAMHEICDDYPELRARIQRFRNSATIINEKTLQRIGMTKEEMESTAEIYKRKLKTTERIRREKNLDESCYVPSALLPTNPFTLAKAKSRFMRNAHGGPKADDVDGAPPDEDPPAGESSGGGEQDVVAQLQTLVQQQDRRRSQVEKQMMQSIQLQAARQSQLEEQWAATLSTLTSQVAALASGTGAAPRPRPPAQPQPAQPQPASGAGPRARGAGIVEDAPPEEP